MYLRGLKCECRRLCMRAENIILVDKNLEFKRCAVWDVFMWMDVVGSNIVVVIINDCLPKAKTTATHVSGLNEWIYNFSVSLRLTVCGLNCVLRVILTTSWTAAEIIIISLEIH